MRVLAFATLCAVLLFAISGCNSGTGMVVVVKNDASCRLVDVQVQSGSHATLVHDVLPGGRSSFDCGFRTTLRSATIRWNIDGSGQRLVHKQIDYPSIESPFPRTIFHISSNNVEVSYE